MKTLSKIIFLFIALSILTGVSIAQNDPQVAIAKKQAELERQRIELEKKSLELQQKELDLEKARQEFQAQQSGRSLSMNLSGDVLFDYDKATLKPEAEQALKKVAVVLSQFPESKVTVEGYTDSKGSKPFNMQLSLARALRAVDPVENLELGLREARCVHQPPEERMRLVTEAEPDQRVAA